MGPHPPWMITSSPAPLHDEPQTGTRAAQERWHARTSKGAGLWCSGPNMTAPSLRTLDRATRRHLIWHAVLRPLATTVLLVGLYYLLPLDHVHARLAVILVAGILIVLAVSAWQLHAITRSRYPAVRAIDALATTAPLFLLLFAATYYLMARTSPGSFNPDHLTRTDTLYFTVTTFSTVGWRHHGGKSGRQAGGYCPDAPRPAGPGPWHPRIRYGRAGGPVAAANEPGRAGRSGHATEPGRALKSLTGGPCAFAVRPRCRGSARH